MSSRIPHTFRRPSGIYYGRVYWPAHIRQILPELPAEQRFSLKTTSPMRAKHSIFSLCELFFQLTVFIEFYVVRINKDAYKDVVSELTKRLKNTDEWRTVMPMLVKEFAGSVQPQPTHHYQHIDVTRGLDSRSQHQLRQSMYGAAPVANRLVVKTLADGQMCLVSDLDDPGESQRELISFFGQYGGSASESTVKDVLEAFTEENLKSGRWSVYATRQNALFRCEEIGNFLGMEKYWASLSREDAKAYRDHLMDAVRSYYQPSKRSSKALAPSTAIDYFQLFKRIAEFAHHEGYHRSNICQSISLSLPRDTRSYASFDEDDIPKILNSAIYTNGECARAREFLSAYFWLPLFGLCTGARLNELCQLRISDIKEMKGVWYLSIQEDELSNPDARKKSLKTEASIRCTPIHSMILKAGFLQFVDERKQALAHLPEIEQQLFEGLTWDPKNRWGKKPGRWHADNFLNELGLTRREKKCFHSYRHTVTQYLSCVCDEPDEKIACIIGHEGKTTTSKYGKDITPTTLRWLQKKIEQIDYGVDTSHISWEHYKEYQACKGRPQKNAHLLRAYRAKQARKDGGK